ncbi:MAG: hypothetical protein L3J89_07075 [Gammaproteobacteria bacterium]|nr:hypothetical protein [Gammaproteobacteria bacterium]
MNCSSKLSDHKTHNKIHKRCSRLVMGDDLLAYVALNSIRAGIARTPETSKHTSIKKRIAQAKTTHLANHSQQQVKGLFPFVGTT